MGKQFTQFPPVEEESIKKREERTAGKGEIFFEHSRMLFLRRQGFWPPPPMKVLLKYKITIEELTSEKIILLYKKSSEPEPCIANLFKPKRLEFSLAEKVLLRVGDYESKKKYTFKILAIEEGGIRYKRTS